MKYNSRSAQKISFQSDKSEEIFLRFLNLFEEHFHSVIEIKRLASSEIPKTASEDGDQWLFPMFYEDEFLALVRVQNPKPQQKMDEVENFLELFLKPLLISEFLEDQSEQLKADVWTLQSKSDLVAQDTAIILHDVTKRLLYLPIEQVLQMDLEDSSLSESTLFVSSVEKLSLLDQTKILGFLRRPAENTAFYISTRLSREEVKNSSVILDELKELMLDRWIQADVLPTEYRLRREALRLFVQKPMDLVETQKNGLTTSWNS